MKRPWQGEESKPDLTERPQYDSSCYLCPGNQRAGTSSNPKYEHTFIFENDFAAVKDEQVNFPQSTAPVGVSKKAAELYRAEPARGKCFVICFSPRHDLTISQLDDASLVRIITAWRTLYSSISQENPYIRYIQIFENKGAMMGCSNPHPHGQAWTLSHIPTVAQAMLSSLHEYQTANSSNLLLDYAQAEIASNSPRLIVHGQHFAAMVPYWATWPFEAMICPTKRRIANITLLHDDEVTDLASVLKKLTTRYDNLFQTLCPYSMGMYQQPTLYDTEYADSAQFCLMFNPPLLRSASVKKFLVGFEMFSEAQRDLTAEQAAGRLRDCSDEHYLGRSDIDSI